MALSLIAAKKIVADDNLDGLGNQAMIEFLLVAVLPDKGEKLLNLGSSRA